MDLYQHKKIILKWISTCETAEQLDLLKNVIAEFVVKRFEGMYEEVKDKTQRRGLMLNLELTKTDLYDAIIERNLIIAGSAA